MEYKCQQLPYIGMDPKYQDNILKNTEKLIDETNYKALVRACREERLLSPEMINKIEAVHHMMSDKLDKEAVQRERHRRLFRKLTKRGPDAYQQLKNILIKLGYHTAVLYLNDSEGDENYKSMHGNKERPSPHTQRPLLNSTQPVNNNIISSDGLFTSRIDKNDDDDDNAEPEEYTGEISPKCSHEVIKSTHIHTDDKVGVYPMISQHKRGVLMVVNIIDFIDKKDYRRGAKQDGESLLYIFREFGFKLYSYVNLTYQQFFQRLGALLKSDAVRDAECFVLALMTHGDMDSYEVERVQFTDGSFAKVPEILHYFNNGICKNLVRKPKILLFPFCRGTSEDYGHKRTQTEGMGNLPVNIPRIDHVPAISDILICYATFRGYQAHRDTMEGSWYIQCLCELMAKHAHNTHFEDIVKMIQNETGEKRSDTGSMQTGNFLNIGFNRKLFFNPGIYE